MATLSSIVGGESPRTEEPDRLQSMGPQRVRYDWEIKHSTTQMIYAHMYICTHVYANIYVCEHMNICICEYMYICICAHMHICICEYMSICIGEYMLIYKLHILYV